MPDSKTGKGVQIMRGLFRSYVTVTLGALLNCAGIASTQVDEQGLARGNGLNGVGDYCMMDAAHN